MKRELAFALEAQSELKCGSLGRTRSSKPQFSKPDVVLSAGNDAVGATTTTSQCNGGGRGGINVYKRNKRLKSENPVEEAANNAGDDLATTPDEAKIRDENPTRFTRSALKDSGGDSKLSKNDDVALVETLEPTVCDVALEATPARKRFTRSALKPNVEEEEAKEEEKEFGELKLNGGGDLALVETLQPAVGEVALEFGDLKLNGGSDLELVETLQPAVGEVALEFGNLELNGGGDLTLKGTAAPRRFTRFALKPVVPVEGELKVEDDGGEVEDEKVIETPTKKLELKMSKKIVLTGRITTVRELLETGLLEGLPVFYHGVAKDKEVAYLSVLSLQD